MAAEVVVDVVAAAEEEEGNAAGQRPSTARFAIPWMCGSSSKDRASRDVVRSMPPVNSNNTKPLC